MRFSELRWRWEVLFFAVLNAVATLPYFFAPDPELSRSGTLGGMAAAAVVSYLQPCINFAFIRAARWLQLIALFLLGLLGLLSIPMALTTQPGRVDWLRLAAGTVGFAAARGSQLGQNILWRAQLERTPA